LVDFSKNKIHKEAVAYKENSTQKVEDSFYDIKDAVGVEVVGLSFHNLIDVDDLNYRYVKSKNVTLL
tara:strand:- start:917 stop:1117 length:201 start_codon:yes stop_codon:yes gene_type:complete